MARGDVQEACGRRYDPMVVGLHRGTLEDTALGRSVEEAGYDISEAAPGFLHPRDQCDISGLEAG